MRNPEANEKVKKFFASNGIVLLFLASAIIVLVVSIFACLLMLDSAKMIEASTKSRLIELSRAVANIEDDIGEQLLEFKTVEDMQKPEYIALKEKLNKFAEEADLVFVYFMRLDDNNMMQYIIDNKPFDAEDFDGLDSAPLARESASDLALSGTATCIDLGNIAYGWEDLMSAYAPVYAKGFDEPIAIACVDIMDTSLVDAYQGLYTFAWVLAGCFVLVFASGLLSIFLYRRKAKQSESANVAKSSFLSRMSHEMRTPLNVIVGLCRMAKETESIDATRNYLENISVASKHLRQVLDDILDLSKIEAGKTEIEITQVNMVDEFEDIDMIIRPQAEAKNLSFKTDIPTDLPAKVYCDGTHLKQVVVNLLSNAIKFTGEGGEVQLQVEVLERRGNSCNIEFRIKDSGIGIDEANLQRIFDPFEQADRNTTRKYGGTGLGLAISKQLVELMGGRLKVDSVLNEGSEFSFDIWVEVAAEAETKKAAVDTNRVLDLSDRHVLIVEDNEINQVIALDAIARFGGDADIASNGLLGYEMFYKNPEKYDIIFMDIQMPIMDGYESTKKIRTCGAPNARIIPIIAMTANVFKEDIDKAMKVGMNGHVGKPFEIDQLKKVMLEVLN